MKRIFKILSVLCVIALLFAVAGCAGKPSDSQGGADNSVSENGETAQNSTNGTNGKILVAYFSCTGTTKKLAEYAADILNADIYEITPKDSYTQEDLAYYTDCRANREQKDPNARPAVSGSVENIAQYDTVLIGYPIWHGEAPRIISTFLESYDFSGKNILPFCTSHSSGIGSSDTNLHSLAEKAKWLSGRRFGAETSKGDIASWLDEMKITSVSTSKAENSTVNNTPRASERTAEMNIIINGKSFTAELYGNETSMSFAQMLPMTAEMKELNGNEKFYYLSSSLPTESQNVGYIEAGDIMLYGDDCIVLFYESFSTPYSYTKIGYITDSSGLAEAVGTGNVTVTFEQQ